MTVRVNDKRRYNADGTPRAGVPEREFEAPSVSGTSEPPASAPQPDEVTQLRSELEAARRRVDELARGIQDVMRDRDEFKQRIRHKLLQKLAASGIERLRLVGRPYDPNVAEAADMELVSSPGQAEKVLG